MSLEHLVSIENYVPSIYKNVKEIDALIKSEDYLFDILISIVDKEYARMFIQTSDETGVERFEKLLEITPNLALETLEFRKQRLLTRCNSTLPYSTIWLKIYLNAVLGEHNYELNIDYKQDIIRLYGYLLDYSWARETSNVIAEIKPCNMIFINIPTMIEHLGLQVWLDDNTWGSNIWNDINIWNDYKLLTSQELQNYEKQKSGQILQTFHDLIYSIRLNETYEITNITKTIQEDGTIYMDLLTPPEVQLLETVEVLDVKGQQLFTKQCFIETPTGTQIVLRLSCYKGKEQ